MLARCALALGMLLMLLPAPEARATAILATWNGGAGVWSDAGLWSFDSPPATATVPDNDASDSFSVAIDGGAGGTASTASLDTSVTVDSVTVDAGDQLTIQDGNTLSLEKSSGRAGAGTIQNDGVVRLDGSGSPTTLTTDSGDLELKGTGVVELGGAGNTIAANGGILYNRAGHTIRGGGTLDQNTLRNEGTLQADAADTLVVGSRLLNRPGTGVVDVSGSGGMTVAGDISNRNLIEVHNGSHLDAGAFRNEVAGSVLRLRDTAEMVLTGNYGVQGTNEILDTSRLEVGGTFRMSGGVTRVQGTLDVLGTASSSVSGGGSLVMDGGSAAFAGDLGFGSLAAGDGRLEGSGTVTAPVVNFSGSTVLAPGEGGAGQLDIVGDLAFKLGDPVHLDLELGGTAPSAYDRVVVSGNANLPSFIDVSTLGGYMPGAGDAFTVLTAAAIDAPPVVDSLLTTVPALPAEQFLTAHVTSGVGTESLQLKVAQRLEATWNGGAGAWSDGSGWSFSGTPVLATVPSNDDDNLFKVIVGGGGGGASDVALDTDATVDRLTVNAGDSLTINGFHALSIAGSGGRAESGVVHNDGLVTVQADGSLEGDGGDLALEGSGTVVLADASSRLSHGGSVLSTLTQGAGHSIEGSGVVEFDVDNSGRIEANDGGTLELTSTALANRSGAVLRSSAGSTLLVGHGAIDLTNAGLIEADGADVVIGNPATKPGGDATNEAGGVLRTRGTGSLTVNGTLTNQGTLEVLDNSSLEVVGTFDATGGSAYVEGTLTFDYIFSANNWDLTLAGGTLADSITLTNGRVAGDGVIDGLQLQEGSVLAPGGADVGSISVVNEFRAQNLGTVYEADIGGTGAGEHDVLIADTVRISNLTIVVTLVDLLGGSNPYTPQVGDTFDVFLAPKVLPSGGITLVAPDLSGHKVWTRGFVDLGGGMQAYRLSVLPEPGTGVLLLVALGALGLASRRR